MRIITDAQYLTNQEEENQTVFCKIDGVECCVPIDMGNTDYVEIKKLIDAGELTIKDAD